MITRVVTFHDDCDCGNDSGGDGGGGCSGGGVLTLTHQIVGVVRATKDRVRRLKPHAGLGRIGHTDDDHARGTSNRFKAEVNVPEAGKVRVKSQKCG